jgi:mercuric ion binding protein
MRTLALISAFALVLLSSSYAMAKERSVTLKVNGMTCVSCPFIVKKSLTRVDGVKSVKVSLKERMAWVVFDDEQATLATLMTATADAGFPSELIQ